MPQMTSLSNSLHGTPTTNPAAPTTDLARLSLALYVGRITQCNATLHYRPQDIVHSFAVLRYTPSGYRSLGSEQVS